jgi:hypothetical protein
MKFTINQINHFYTNYSSNANKRKNHEHDTLKIITSRILTTIITLKIQITIVTLIIITIIMTIKTKNNRYSKNYISKLALNYLLTQSPNNHKSTPINPYNPKYDPEPHNPNNYCIIFLINRENPDTAYYTK